VGVADGAAVAVFVGVAVGAGGLVHPTSTQDGTSTTNSNAQSAQANKVTDSTERGVRRAIEVRFIGLFSSTEWQKHTADQRICQTYFGKMF
jgi:hypothetical protein